METQKHPISIIKNCIIAELITAVVGIIAIATMLVVAMVSVGNLEQIAQMTDQQAGEWLIENITAFGGVMWAITLFLTILSAIYFIYIKGLGGFMAMVDQDGKSAVQKLKNAATINFVTLSVSTLCALLVALTPGNIVVLGIAMLPLLLAVCAAIVAVIINFIGFNELRKVESLGENGKKGAKQLLTAYIVLVASSLISSLPVLGGLISIAGAVIYYIYTLGGWSKIKEKNN